MDVTKSLNCHFQEQLQRAADDSDEGEVHTDEEDAVAAPPADVAQQSVEADVVMSPVSDVADDHSQERPVPDQRRDDDDHPGAAGDGPGPGIVTASGNSGKTSAEGSKSEKRSSSSSHTHSHVSKKEAARFCDVT